MTVAWSALWLLPAAAVLIAVAVAAWVLRAAAAEALALRDALGRWDRIAVAVADLEHDAQRADRSLRALRSRRQAHR